MIIKATHINEPRLLFHQGNHVCPRKGITTYGVFDQSMATRRTALNIGAVGSTRCLESLDTWLDLCANPINTPQNTAQPNLKVPFCGFNNGQGFHSHFNFNNELSRPIRNSDIEDTLDITDHIEKIEYAINLYYEEVKFLAQNRVVDVIICVIPESLYATVGSEQHNNSDQDGLPDNENGPTHELNFRRALKAKCMYLGKPLQLIRATSLIIGGKGQQDDATKAWNFCTALYYKAGATNPWKLASENNKPTSCAVGIAFYRSRDRKVLHTSLAQIFDELGNGLILRGTPVQMDKNDRVPRLSSQQAHDLLIKALNEYRVALRAYPARVVVHKSSNFTTDEMFGLKQAAKELHINTIDFVTIMDSKIRLFRDGGYPPYRGTMLTLNDNRHLLYTRGSVWYYQTYPGMYIPQPLELRVVKSEETPLFLAEEILGLTKMNWNNTQFDGKYPVTLGCARKVGEIMKYMEEGERPQVRYGFYM